MVLYGIKKYYMVLKIPIKTSFEVVKMETCYIDRVQQYEMFHKKSWKERLFDEVDLYCYIPLKNPNLLVTIYEDKEIVDINILNINLEDNPGIWLKRLKIKLKERYYHEVKQLSLFDNMCEVHGIRRRKSRRTG